MRYDAVGRHTEAGDYFAALAAVLDLLRQDLEDNSVGAWILGTVRDELLYLQANYRIVKRGRRFRRGHRQ